MNHLETELQLLKTEIMEMCSLVKSQLIKGKQTLSSFDKDLAREIISTEKRVNAYELKIDKDCENIFALFNPVAIDLRFVLAVLKINNNLERIGDNAEGIAKYVISVEKQIDKEFIEALGILKMFDIAENMLSDVVEAIEKENSPLARGVFKKDEALDVLNVDATKIIANYIKDNLDKTYESLYLLSIVRKLERIGDQTTNIAEEIIFYLEAKVLKHKSTQKKSGEG